MRFEKLAQSLRLSAVAMFSVFLFACGEGDGPEQIDDPRFEECPGPNCPLNEEDEVGGPAGGAGNNLLINGSFEDDFAPWFQNTGGGLLAETNQIFTVDVNAVGNIFEPSIAQNIPLADGESYTLSFRARASLERVMTAGIGLNYGSFANAAGMPELTTEWQRFSYDLVAPGGSAGGGRVFFDIGGVVEGTVFIDDISVAPTADPGAERVTDGSFTTPGTLAANYGVNNNNTSAPAAVIGEAGNDTVYTFDVLTNGDPFKDNLSQEFTITPDVTYRLEFRARTRNVAARTIRAGIGLNQDPFTAVFEEPILRDNDWRSYSYTFTPDFGGAKSRVLFDMGAAIGDVFIDDVIVTVVE